MLFSASKLPGRTSKEEGERLVFKDLEAKKGDLLFLFFGFTVAKCTPNFRAFSVVLSLLSCELANLFGKGLIDALEEFIKILDQLFVLVQKVVFLMGNLLFEVSYFFFQLAQLVFLLLACGGIWIVVVAVEDDTLRSDEVFHSFVVVMQEFAIQWTGRRRSFPFKGQLPEFLLILLILFLHEFSSLQCILKGTLLEENEATNLCIFHETFYILDQKEKSLLHRLLQ